MYDQFFVESEEEYGSGKSSIYPKAGLPIARFDVDGLPAIASPRILVSGLKGIPVG